LKASSEYKKICPVCKGTGKFGKVSGNGANTTGFSAMPSGRIQYGDAQWKGENAYWWCSDTSDDSNRAYSWRISANFGILSEDHTPKEWCISVRCVKD
jgi:uncharacterized protein (TIGR02145 family)